MHALFWLSLVGFISPAQTSESTQPAAPAESQEVAGWKKCVAASEVLYREGRFDETARVLEQAVRYAETFPVLDPRLPRTIHSLAFINQEQLKYNDAASLYLRAIRLWEQIGSSQRDALLRSTDGLIATYIQSRNYRAAKKLVETRLPEMERSEMSWKQRAAILSMRASLAGAGHHYAEAEHLYWELLALCEENSPASDRNMAVVLMNLSYVLGETKRYQEALKIAQRAMPVLDKVGAIDNPLLIQALNQVGLLYMKLKCPSDAVPIYERALALAKQTFGPDHVVSAHVMLHYSETLHMLRQDKQAKLMAGEAQVILQHSDQNRWKVDVRELGFTSR